MAPGGDDPEPEAMNDSEAESALERLTSRYDMNERSLGHLYPSVFLEPMFRVEGVIAWMYSRCFEWFQDGNVAADEKSMLQWPDGTTDSENGRRRSCYVQLVGGRGVAKARDVGKCSDR